MRIHRERDGLKSATIADLNDAYEMFADHISLRQTPVADAACTHAFGRGAAVENN
jgi:hypothetical protein